MQEDIREENTNVLESLYPTRTWEHVSEAQHYAVERHKVMSIVRFRTHGYSTVKCGGGII